MLPNGVVRIRLGEAPAAGDLLLGAFSEEETRRWERRLLDPVAGEAGVLDDIELDG